MVIAQFGQQVSAPGFDGAVMPDADVLGQDSLGAGHFSSNDCTSQGLQSRSRIPVREPGNTVLGLAVKVGTDNQLSAVLEDLLDLL